MSLINQKGLSVINTNNQFVPTEGPMAVPIILDFTLADTYELDFELMQTLGKFSMLQTVFIDLQESDIPLVMTVNGSGYQLKAKGRTQGFYTVLAPNPLKVTFSCPGGPLLKVFLCNGPIPGHVWATQ